MQLTNIVARWPVSTHDSYILGGFLVSNFIRVIVLILLPMTCIEHVRPQFLPRIHSIITSRWLKLVSCCFLMVKLQLKIFLTSP